MTTWTLKKFLHACLAACLLGLGAPVQGARAAGSCSWDGSVNANWSNAGNWSSGCSGAGGIPGSGDSLTFPSGAAHTSMTDDLPALSLGNLIFPSNTGYTLNGANTISLSGGIDVQAGTQTVNTPLAVLNNSVTFKAASGTKLILGGKIAIGSHTLTALVNTAAGATGMEVENTLSGGTDGSPGRLLKSGAGDLKITGDSTYEYLDIDLNAGSISTKATSATQLPRYGTLTLASGTNLNLLNYDGVGPFAGSGHIHLSNSLIVWQNKDTTFTGDLFGVGQMNIMGNGLLTINRSGGALSFSGEIYVNVGPSHLKLVNTTATALADFRVNGNNTNSTLELNSSHVSVVRLAYPGDNRLVAATLILSGTRPSSASQVIVESSGCGFSAVVSSASDYGHLEVATPVDLGGQNVSLLLGGSYVPKVGDTFNILRNTSSGPAILNDGRFQGLAQGGTLTFNAVALKANYQAGGNTTFALAKGSRLYLPLVRR